MKRPRSRHQDEDDEEIDSDLEAGSDDNSEDEKHSRGSSKKPTKRYDGEDDDEDDDEDGGDEEDDEKPNETPEEKRLRLAEEFLTRFKAKHRTERRDDDDGDDDGHRDGDEGEGRLLRGEMQELAGRKYARLANKLSGADVPATTAKLLRGHSLSVTCVAMSGDGAVLVSGSKDCSLIRWDAETGKRLVTHKGARKGIFFRGKPRGHKGEVLACSVSPDGRYTSSGGADGFVHLWDNRTDTLIQSFAGHRESVSGVAFHRRGGATTAGTYQLYSCSFDRTVKVWSVDEMAYVETLFGHQGPVQGIDSLNNERVVTCGSDLTCRYWKIYEDSQLVFDGHTTSIECVNFLTGNSFVSGSQDGSLALWELGKKKPIKVVQNAHAQESVPEAPVVYQGAEFDFSQTPAWISSISCLQNSDMVASGSCNGFVNIWQANTDQRKLKKVYSVPVPGFINGLAFADKGNLLVAGLGQEHRLGRWWRTTDVRNGIAIIRLPIE